MPNPEPSRYAIELMKEFGDHRIRMAKLRESHAAGDPSIMPQNETTKPLTEGFSLYQLVRMQAEFRHLPEWDRLPTATQEKWESVAEAINADQS